LDADNWFYPNHIEAMVELHKKTNAAVCTASRTIHRGDGSLMFFDQHNSDGIGHVDTSCLIFTRAAFQVLPLWVMMPKELGPVCDRVFWQAIRARKIQCAHHPQPTVAFRTQYQLHYAALGEPAPPGDRLPGSTYDRRDGGQISHVSVWGRGQPWASRFSWSGICTVNLTENRIKGPVNSCSCAKAARYCIPFQSIAKLKSIAKPRSISRHIKGFPGNLMVHENSRPSRRLPLHRPTFFMAIQQCYPK
jgi:hypothetical protein